MATCRLAAQLASGLLLPLMIGFLFLTTASDTALATIGDLRTLDVTIFTADGRQIIGHGHYTMVPNDGSEVVQGLDKYFNGEYDTEIESIRLGRRGESSTLLTYEHSFLNSDRSLQRVVRLDSKNGAALCQTHVGNRLSETRAILNVPSDTYAGAAQILFISDRLRQGTRRISFHSFNCAPGPKIIAAAAIAGANGTRWSMYPGDLVKLEIQPDLGLLDLLLSPFLPKMYAWFNPQDNWNYVGGLYTRFYGGPHILTVRALQAAVPYWDKRP